MCGSQSNVLKDSYASINDSIIDQLYVADRDNHRMMNNNCGSTYEFLIVVGNGVGSDPTQFNSIMRVGFHTKSNSFLLANSLNNDVLRFVAEAKSWTEVTGKNF